MKLSSAILSSITVFSKYARFQPNKGRRETWEEIVERNKIMHMMRYPKLAHQIVQVYDEYVLPKKVLPSMRSLQFAGKAIERNPSRIYNCFSGDTEFMTDEGIRKFKDVVGTEVNVFTEDKSWHPAKVKSFGEQQLYRITMKHPYRTNLRMTVEATENHRWILEDGTQTTELTEGHRVKYNINDGYSDPDQYWNGYVHGLFFADGTKAKEGRYMIRLCGNKAKELKHIKHHDGFKTVCYPPSYNGDPVATIVTDKNLKSLPYNETEDYLAGFIDGWTNFDGYSKRGFDSYCLDTTDEEAAQWLINHAPYAGLIATGINTTDKPTNYGERTNPLIRISLSPKAKYWLVENIEKTEIEEVYCVVEPITQTFTLAGGILTGNCAYLPLEDVDAFSEIMFLLLGGTGVGYSVQKRHVKKLPPVVGPTKDERRYVIGDSIEG